MPDDIADLETDNPVGEKDTTDSGSAKPEGKVDGRDWLKDLPEPLRGHKAWEKFKSKDDVFRSYVELEGKLGSSIQVPKDSDPADVWAKFFARAGRPEKPEGFDIPAGKFQAGAEKALREGLLMANVTKVQVPGVIEAISKATSAASQERRAAIEARVAQEEKALRETLGDQYEETMTTADKAVAAVFPEGTKEILAQAGLMRNPAFVASLAAIGAQLGDTKIVLGAKGQAKPKDPYDWMREKYGQK